MTQIPSQIFRPEALQAEREEWLGRPSLSRPLFAVFWSAVSVLTLLGVLGILAFGYYTKQVKLRGRVINTSGIINVPAYATGVLNAKYIKDGQYVNKGERLYSVIAEAVIEEGSSSTLILNELQNQLTATVNLIQSQKAEGNQRLEDLSQQIDEKRRELAQLSDLVERIRGHTKWLDQLAQRQHDIVERGLGLEQSYTNRRNDYHASTVELATAEQSYMQLTNEVEDLQRNLKRLPIEIEHNEQVLAKDAAQIRQKIIEARQAASAEVIAPVSGTITGPIRNVGEAVKPSDSLVTIIPIDGMLAIDLEGTSDEIGLLKIGTNVLIRFDSFPYQRFGQFPTTIKTISAAPRPLPAGAPLSSAMYIIRLALPSEQLYYQSSPLIIRPGMTVEAYALVERRPLYEWLFLPLIERANS